MAETGKPRITIRAGRHTLSFSMMELDDSGQTVIKYEPYTVRSGMSMAANLREAFKTSDLLALDTGKAQVLVDSPVLMTPVEIFEEAKMADFYHHAYPASQQELVLYNVLPDLNAVAVFSMNRDLKLVLDDHFPQLRLFAALTPVWRHLHQRSFTGVRNKLFGYFHDKCLDLFAFQQNRFKFCNQFDVTRAHDALYFVLYVWKQLMLKAEDDELYIVGDIPEQEWLVEQLRRYLQKAFVINPSADFNRGPATQVKGMPYDLMTLFTKGR